jgi:hypothetical protein
MWCFLAASLLFCVVGLIVLTTSADRAWANLARRARPGESAAERTPEWDARYRTGRWLGGGSMLLGGIALLAWAILRLVLGAR